MYVIRIFSFLFWSFCSLVVSAAQPQALWQTEAAPAWVAVPTVPLATTPSNDTLDYLLSDTQVNLTLPALVAYHHLAYRINDSLGVEENSDIEIVFNPDFERVIFHHVSIIRDGKVIDRLQENDVRIIDLEPEAANRIYSGYKQLTLWLKGVSKGDVIDYSYSVVGQNPVFEKHFNRFFDLGWGLPVSKVNLRILSPSQRPLHHRFINSQATLQQSTQGQTTIYSLTLQDTPAVMAEGDTPSWEVIYPYLQISDFDSWAEVSAWAVNLFKSGNAPRSAELNHYIEELRSLPKKQAIEKALAFTQEHVRYLGIEIAENSHLPHSPSEVFANRYGDCKDKSLLLVTLLQGIGIPASPVLVSTETQHATANFLPAYNLFNHAIAEFQFEGQRYWVDPTMSHQAERLEAISQAEYGLGLVVAAGQTALTSMPESSAEQNQIRVVQRYLAADYISPVDWQVTTIYSGREADRMRYRLASAGEKRLSSDYFNYYAKLYAGLEKLDDIEVADDRLTNRLTIREYYRLPHFWSVNGSSAVFTFYADVIDSYIKLPDQVNRTQPLALYGQVDVSQRLELWLPEHIDFSSRKEQAELEDDFFHYEVAFDYQHRRLVYSSRYRTKQRSVPVEQVADHIALLRKARKYLEYGQSITHVTEDPSFASMQKLVQYIQQQQQQLNL